MPLPETKGKPSGRRYDDADDNTPVREYENDMRTGARGVIRSRAKARMTKGQTRDYWLNDADEYQRDVQRGAERGMGARRKRAAGKRR